MKGCAYTSRRHSSAEQTSIFRNMGIQRIESSTTSVSSSGVTQFCVCKRRISTKQYFPFSTVRHHFPGCVEVIFLFSLSGVTTLQPFSLYSAPLHRILNSITRTLNIFKLQVFHKRPARLSLQSRSLFY